MVGACFIISCPTSINRVKSTNLPTSSISSPTISSTCLPSNFYLSSFLLYKLSTISEYICPPPTKSKPLTVTWYLSYMEAISCPKVVVLERGPTVHRSHRLVSSF